MSACLRPGCDGSIADGYCDVCGMAAQAPAPVAVPAPVATVATASSTAETTTVSRRNRGSRPKRLRSGLVSVPDFPVADPADAVMERAVVAENRRFCSRCDQPVGRGRDGSEGRAEGFCSHCGAPFSFIPKLGAGDLVAGQYEVAGCLAHGGLGWIYLARDRFVSDRWVVLKGLLNSDDEDAMAAAIAERSFLAEVEHPNIVKIFNFVTHEGSGYIVMEYVGGPSLRDILKARQAANGGRVDPLPAAQAIAYVLDVLPALGHLHERGLLFCDFKPDNVIQTPDGVKLIDLGGVFRIGDESSPIYGTVGYQAPEIARSGPSVSSDLYSVARTLAVLCTEFRGYQSTYEHALPAPEAMPLYARFDSLHRVLVKGTAQQPGQRFQTAEELGDQLFGVLREIVAAEDGTTTQRQSALFTTDLRARPDAPDWRLLPAPRVDGDDPAAGYLASVTASEPGTRLALLARAPVETLEVEFQRLAAHLAGGDDAAAGTALAALRAQAGDDWRVAWYEGVLALAGERPRDAQASFTAVYDDVPGELAPKLALGVAAEMGGEHAAAIRWYGIVARTDPWHTTAAFGLARCAAAERQLSAALEAYDHVPEASVSYTQAQAAKIRCQLDPELGANRSVSSLRAAGATLERIDLDAEQHAELLAELLLSALLLVEEEELALPAEMTIAGCAFAADDLRVALERTYRELARFAATSEDRVRYVDWANRVRPRSWT